MLFVSGGVWIVLVTSVSGDYSPRRQRAGWSLYVSAAEESPGSMETRCRLTAGGGDPRESATENKPPFQDGKGEKVR